MAGFADFGNDSGYLYVTRPDGTTIVSSPPNTNPYAKWLLHRALIAAPSSGEVLATGTVTVNVGAGTITTCTVNGVDVMGASVATGATPALLATDLASKINSTLSSPDYTATVIGASANIVQIKALAGTGATPNGFVVSAGVTAPTTVTTANMDGGVDGSGIYSPIFGERFFINSNASATQNSLAGSVEITANIAKRGLESELYSQSLSLSSHIVAPIRVGAISVLTLDTQGGVGTDTLSTITATNFQNGDILIISGVNASHVVTIQTSGNIHLVNDTSWATGAAQNQILLQYQTSGTIGWYEVTRSATLPNVAALRAQNIACPIQGVNTADMGTSGTTTFQPGVDKGYQVITGSPVLVGGIVYATGGSPIDGDSFTVDYRATPTIGGNTVTIFGITLTTTQTQQKCVVKTTYKTSNTTWYSTLYVNGNSVDFATTTQLATKQDTLPASGGDTFVLQKTIGGVLSFVPPSPGGVVVASGTYTPTLTNVSNIASSTPSQCQYMRVGSVVTVSGHVIITPSGAGSTELGMSLPIASNLTISPNLGGTAFSANYEEGMSIGGDIANDRAEFFWTVVNVIGQGFNFSFTYLIQ